MARSSMKRVRRVTDNNKVKIDWRGSSKSIKLNKRGVLRDKSKPVPPPFPVHHGVWEKTQDQAISPTEFSGVIQVLIQCQKMDRVKKRLSQDEFSFLGGRLGASERTYHQWQRNQHQLRSVIFIRVIVVYLIIKVQFGVNQCSWNKTDLEWVKQVVHV